MASTKPSLFSSLTRGAFAGVVGSAVLGLVQETVEMPLTGRGESYAPAHFAHQLLGLEHHDDGDVFNWASHLAFGSQWGIAHALVARRGLHGIPALVTAFATVYPVTVAVGTALDVYRPSEWTGEEWAIDVLDKLFMAAVAGVAYRVLGPRRRSHGEDHQEDTERPRRGGHRPHGPNPSGPTPTTSWGH